MHAMEGTTLNFASVHYLHQRRQRLGGNDISAYENNGGCNGTYDVRMRPDETVGENQSLMCRVMHW